MIERTRPETCLSDLVLDRVVAGELPRPDHVATCTACEARLTDLRAQAALPLPPPPTLRPRSRRGALVGAASSMLAVAAVVVLWVRPLGPGTRLKGSGFGLEVVVKHDGNGRVETLAPGAALRPGDAIRFRVSSDRPGHLIIVGLDSAGAVTAYAPARGAALPLAPKSGQLLPGSIVLDDTLGPERLVALRCAAPVDVATVVEAARRALGAAHGDPRTLVRLGIGCDETGLVFEKVRR